MSAQLQEKVLEIQNVAQATNAAMQPAAPAVAPTAPVVVATTQVPAQPATTPLMPAPAAQPAAQPWTNAPVLVGDGVIITKNAVIECQGNCHRVIAENPAKTTVGTKDKVLVLSEGKIAPETTKEKSWRYGKICGLMAAAFAAGALIVAACTGSDGKGNSA